MTVTCLRKVFTIVFIVLHKKRPYRGSMDKEKYSNFGGGKACKIYARVII